MQNYDSSWGKIVLTIRLNPKTHEEREYYYGRGKWTTIAGMDGQTNKRIKSQLYDSIVSIVLIKGDNIDLDHDYCIRMKLGMEKYKSKTAVKSVRSPYWAEQFDLHLYADQSKVLEITLGYSGQQHHHQQNNDFIDKVCTDLSELEPEHTHRFVYEFNTNPMMVNRNSMTTLSITSAACNSSNNNSFNKSTTMMMARIEMLVTITGLQSSSTTKQQQQETYDMIQIQQQQQQQQQPNSLKQLISLAKLKV